MDASFSVGLGRIENSCGVSNVFAANAQAMAAIQIGGFAVNTGLWVTTVKQETRGILTDDRKEPYFSFVDIPIGVLLKTDTKRGLLNTGFDVSGLILHPQSLLFEPHVDYLFYGRLA